MIKEQGKCFELARTGRELILLLREDENNEGVEDLLNVRLPTHLRVKCFIQIRVNLFRVNMNWGNIAVTVVTVSIPFNGSI